MKVFLLGGYGMFGRLTADLMVASDLVTRVVIAGRNVESARRVAGELGDKACGVRADATDEAGLAALLADCDLLINTAGPYDDTIVPAIRAAILSRTHYCDISDEAHPVGLALELDDEARAAGITAIICIGLSAVTNLLAAYAATQLDEVDEIQCCFATTATSQWRWGAPGSSSAREAIETIRKTGRVGASLEVFLRMFAAPRRAFRAGRWVDLPAGHGSGVEIRTPEGHALTMYAVPMCSDLTLPRHIRGVKTVSGFFGFDIAQVGESFFDHALRVEAGTTSMADAAIDLIEMIDTLPAADPPRLGAWTVALGRKGGRKARYAVRTAGRDSTHGPLAAAAFKILRGEVSEHGVLPPEACLDPKPFLAEAARLSPQPPEGDLLVESLEWLE